MTSLVQQIRERHGAPHGRYDCGPFEGFAETVDDERFMQPAARGEWVRYTAYAETLTLLQQAADRIEELEAALRTIAVSDMTMGAPETVHVARHVLTVLIARHVLGDSPKGER